MKSSLFTGSNAEQTRRHNRRVVLGQIRTSRRMGRAEIARISGLSVQAVSNIIASLLSEGLLIEDGQICHGRGLPATQYKLNPEGGYALGFEISPRSISAALLNITGDLYLKKRLKMDNCEPAAISQRVHNLMHSMLEETGVQQEQLLGAGIVMPGPFIPTGLANTSSVLAGWENIDPVQLFSHTLSVPVLVENDANAAAVGEQVSGCAAKLRNYAFIYFGTGLGLGIVQDGDLFRGCNGNAGELGHILVPQPASRATMPTTELVPLETVASRIAMQHSLKQVGIQVDSIQDIEQLAISQSPELDHWLSDAASALSHAIHVVENLFDPDTVVIGGALPDIVLSVLIDRIALAQQSIAHRENRQYPRIMQGQSGWLSAAQGGAALVINQLFTPRSLS
ncbi:ROK family transcriptional regulator [Granulosicoccus antarcticus]|nr:ROK family transcriptional regulator [Granulosicoccus antarcticus]